MTDGTPTQPLSTDIVVEREISHRGVSYRQIALERCRDQAEALIAANRKWHSHVFSPICIHNPFEGVYAIVIEDDTAHVPYIAKGTTEFPEVDKDLVKLLHGDDILDAGKAKGGTEVAKTSLLLAHVMRLQDRDMPWHHHMHFPECAFNPMQGRWSISVEADGTFFAEGFDEEPVDVLREVEVIYFGNLEKKQSGHKNCAHGAGHH